jgi:predicted peroxiredoxin
MLGLVAVSFLGQSIAANASDKPAAAASPAPAPASGSASPPAKVEQAPSPSPSPISVSRFVSLPEFKVFSLQGRSPEDLAQAEKQLSTAKVYDYQQARFTLVVALSSWSSRAAEVAVTVQSWQARLNKRGVKIVGIFTHDSLEDIMTMAKKQGVTFLVAKVGLDFVAKLLNPKVPTLWIVDHQGHVVYRKERPSDSDISETEQYLLDWTDF